MNFKYTLPELLIKKVVSLEDFANGGHQVTIRLKDGTTFEKALISNSTWIVAMRGYKDLPFAVSDIEEIFQSEEDKHPTQRYEWEYWDDWGPLSPK